MREKKKKKKKKKTEKEVMDQKKSAKESYLQTTELADGSIVAAGLHHAVQNRGQLLLYILHWLKTITASVLLTRFSLAQKHTHCELLV